MSVLSKSVVDALNALLQNKVKGDGTPEAAKLTEFGLAATSTVQDFADRVGGWHLEAGKKGVMQAPKSGPWTWTANIAADASLGITPMAETQLVELGINDVGLSAKDGQPSPDRDRVLAFEIDASLSGAVDAAGTVSAGKGALNVEAAAKGSASHTLTWYVQANAKDHLGQVILDATDSWFVAAFDLDRMFTLANSSRWWGAALHAKSQASVEVKARAEASALGWTYGLSGAVSNIGVSIGVNGSYTRKVSGDLQLSVICELPPAPASTAKGFGLRVKLQDVNQKSTAIAWGGDITLDLASLIDSAEQLIRAQLPEPSNELLAGLDALTRPGTAIQESIRQAIEEKLRDDSLKQLALILAGINDTTAMQANLSRQLAAPLVNLIDRSLASVVEGSADAQAITTAWLKSITGDQELVDAIVPKAKTLVAEAINKAESQLKGKLDTWSSAVSGKSDVEVAKALAPLGELGTLIKQKFETLDSRAKPAVERFKDALNDYSGYRNKLIDQLETAKKLKIQAAVSLERTLEQGSDTLLDVWFGQPTDEGRHLFNALVSGQLGQLLDLVEAAERSGAILDAKGHFITSHRRVKTSRLTISLPGAAFDAGKSWLADFSTNIDLHGNLVLNSKVSASAHTISPWTDRSAVIAVQIDCIAGLVAGTPVQVQGRITGTFTAADKKSDEASVRAFLDNYGRATGTTAPVDLGGLLGRPKLGHAAEANFWRSLSLEIPMSIDGFEWQTLLSANLDQVDRIALNHAVKCAGLVYNGKDFKFKLPGDSVEAQLDALASTALPAFGDKSTEDRRVAYLQLFDERGANIDLDSRLGFRTELDLRSYESLYEAYRNIAMVQRAPRALIEALIQLTRLAERAPAQIHGQMPPQLQQAFDRTLKNAEEGLRWVALSNRSRDGDKDAANWCYIAFVLTLAEVCGKSGKPPYPPLVTTLVNGTPATLSLSYSPASA